jgi:hypothetical protein
MVSGKSLLKSPTSSCARACRAMTTDVSSRNQYSVVVLGMFTFESLLDVNGLLCTRLEVGDAAFRLAEGHRALRRNLVVV